MTICPICGCLNLEESKNCVKCRNSLTEQQVVPITVTPEKMLSETAANNIPPKTITLDTVLLEHQRDENRRQTEKEERVSIEKNYEQERKKRIKAEEELNRLKQSSTDRNDDTKRLHSELNFLKDAIKTGITAVAALIVALVIVIMVIFSGRAKKDIVITELSLYKDRYDSIFVSSRVFRSERDSLRSMTMELQDRITELSEISKRAPAVTQRGGSRTVNIPIEMVAVKGGKFMMGCTSEQGNSCDSNEKPAHEVTVSGFSIGKYPVTQELWRQVMGSNPSQYRGDDKPVEQVSWRDAQDFIVRLNQMTGRRYRLPTEAEWEFAARGGLVSRGYKYAGSSRIEEVAWYARSNGTNAVGAKRPNELGIYDMSGNVREWVGDRYGEYSGTTATNPSGSKTGNNRVLRGGSWTNMAKSCRVTDRTGYPSGARSNYIGFRLAISQ